MIYVLLFILGSIVGSFLNVCIYRLPRRESIIKPGSHCPKCGHKVRWHENIPIISFIMLGGKCSRCKQPISYIYPVVEFITAIVLVTLYIFFGLSAKTVLYFILFCALIVSTFIDFERKEIPDVITLPGIIIGLISSLLFPSLMNKARPLDAFFVSSLGVIMGGGCLYITGFFGEIIFKKEAMGGGDIKLLAMIGSFLGWKTALLTFFMAPFFGVIAGAILKIKEGKDVIPYGPYISLAAFVSLLWGEEIVRFLFIR